MIHKACMPVYMSSGKLSRTGGRGFEGSTRGPRGPKKRKKTYFVEIFTN